MPPLPPEDALNRLGPDIRVPKTAEIIADRFRRQIIKGELPEDSFLPPEGQLMATLGISRPTLREAFRILEAENLISVMRGSRTGARVHRPRVESVTRYAGFVLQAEGTSLGDVYEARLAIEPYIARRLAESRSAEAVAKLTEETERLRLLVEAERYVDFMIGLAQFHHLLVKLGGNRTLLFLTEVMQGVLVRHQVEFFGHRRLSQEMQRKRSLWGVSSFRKLISLIETGDAAGAEAHWRAHVTNANRFWVEGFGDSPVAIFD